MTSPPPVLLASLRRRLADTRDAHKEPTATTETTAEPAPTEETA